MDGRSLWFTPGGRIESGESPEEVARRELREETGVDPAMLRGDGLAWLRVQRGTSHPLIMAAVAHLEFVGIHPFDDGNGRTARALTTYFAVRGGWNLRGLASTEALFGRDRMRYYEQIQRYQGASYQPPKNDVTLWCVWVLNRFSIEIAAVIRIIERWNELRSAPPDTRSGRAVGGGYMYLALAGTVSSSDYAHAVGISTATAVTQLDQMVGYWLAMRTGRGSSTRYVEIGDYARKFAALSYAEAFDCFGKH